MGHLALKSTIELIRAKPPDHNMTNQYKHFWINFMEIQDVEMKYMI